MATEIMDAGGEYFSAFSIRLANITRISTGSLCTILCGGAVTATRFASGTP